jgi:tagaturonate reductase
LTQIQSLSRKHYPVKILQFGAGNFLRGFADWMVQKANEHGVLNAGVCVVQSVSSSDALERQQGIYHVRQSGIYQDEYKTLVDRVDVIQRTVQVNNKFHSFLEEGKNPDLEFIISNTTETGIQFLEEPFENKPAKTFPGKLTQLLLHRFQHQLTNQVILLPCELIEKNGERLKECVLQYSHAWKLGNGFRSWLDKNIVFCNTLVDRIVTAAPQKENGLTDELFLETELFHLWAIECPLEIEHKIPFNKAGLNVILTRDISIYRTRKVRILNGAHSTIACAGYLANIATVREVVEHPVMGRFLRRLVYDEILPTLDDNLNELELYAEEVFNRFKNPSIKHDLINITLSSFAKFHIRLIPTITSFYNKKGFVPERIVFSLAATLFFYRGLKAGKDIPLKDTVQTIATLKNCWANATFTKQGMIDLVSNVFAKVDDLNDLQNFANLTEHVGHHLYTIDQVGVLHALKEMQEKEYLI